MEVLLPLFLQQMCGSIWKFSWLSDLVSTSTLPLNCHFWMMFSSGNFKLDVFIASILCSHQSFLCLDPQSVADNISWLAPPRRLWFCPCLFVCCEQDYPITTPPFFMEYSFTFQFRSGSGTDLCMSCVFSSWQKPRDANQQERHGWSLMSLSRSLSPTHVFHTLINKHYNQLICLYCLVNVWTPVYCVTGKKRKCKL